MRWTPEDYRAAALDRIGEASALRRSEHFGLCMYVSGLAAECMLRAYHRPDKPFDERHDIIRLFQACDLDRLGDPARRQLRGPIQTIDVLWTNTLRFAHEEMVKQHVRRLRADRGVRRGASFLKARSIDLYNACDTVVTVGGRRWTQS